MSINSQSGGDLIGAGSFGCVFHPALKCEKQSSVHDDMVSKVFFSGDSKKEAEEEIKIDKMIKSIKGYENWAHIWTTNCLPKKYNSLIKEESGIDDCLNENGLTVGEFDKNRRMLQGTYAGKSFGAVFGKLGTVPHSNKKVFIKNFLDMMKLMKPLFIGLVEMNKKKISHNDIKVDNIMVDNDGCKYIDFGLAAKHSNQRFFKQRSMSEFVCDRIYPCYPYEFIYLFATEDVLLDEKSDKEYNIYRDLHERYQLVHETIFKRVGLKEYLLGLIDRALEGKLIKEKQNIISLIDTYSVGILIPAMLARLAKSHNKLSQLKKLLMEKEIKPFMELFKDMSEPNNYDRLNPIDAYQRYLELESIYLKSNKKHTIKRELRRFRK
jgi:serine/threonine protein kinase